MLSLTSPLYQLIETFEVVAVFQVYAAWLSCLSMEAARKSPLNAFYTFLK